MAKGNTVTFEMQPQVGVLETTVSIVRWLRSNTKMSGRRIFNTSLTNQSWTIKITEQQNLSWRDAMMEFSTKVWTRQSMKFDQRVWPIWVLQIGLQFVRNIIHSCVTHPHIWRKSCVQPAFIDSNAQIKSYWRSTIRLHRGIDYADKIKMKQESRGSRWYTRVEFHKRSTSIKLLRQNESLNTAEKLRRYTAKSGCQRKSYCTTRSVVKQVKVKNWILEGRTIKFLTFLIMLSVTQTWHKHTYLWVCFHKTAQEIKQTDSNLKISWKNHNWIPSRKLCSNQGHVETDEFILIKISTY